MLKLVAFAFFVASTNAFWTGCNIPGVIGPDRVESPFCSATSCSLTRGQTLLADVWFTPVRAHTHLMVAVTAFIAGIGVPVKIKKLKIKIN